MKILKTLALMMTMLCMSSVNIMAQSPTEGVINSTFVDEPTMKQDLLQMLANFSTYLKNDFQSVDNTYGYFKGESSGQNNEAGVRTNADLSMICAFLVKYAQPAGVTLPSGVSWTDIQTMAKKSLAWAYATHKANKLRQTTNNAYWGSTSSSDNQWESSLWAMSVAYSAFFQWNDLSAAQRNYIYAMLKAECNYELTRSIPTGYAGDTKAEENGWEVNVLAATLGLFPNDELASQWFDRMRQFAVNSYSHVTDMKNNTPFDPSYDSKAPADLYLGKNLYDDYTLQNHNMFHTSYQNVVMQELGESLLALKMFQQGLNGTEKWKSKALMHNNQEVMDHILDWLATADGELAMPNGNDWSLFLFDQITSYSTQACFNRDPNALMLENLAYKNIKARQTTTSDGSWLLRPDVSARRMGVEAHRVMMTFLMHEYASTADITPTTWEDFQTQFAKTKYFPAQNIIRSMSKDRFTCFSWNTSLPDYSGVIVPNSVDKAKIMVPFRTHHTGNLLGVYSRADYSLSKAGVYSMFPEGYAMNGVVTFNSIPQAFCLFATSGNAVIMVDALKAASATSVSSEQGGMMGISVDEFTNNKRTIYYNGGSVTTDGSSYATWTSPWSNIDNYLGFVVTKHGETVTGAFGDKSNNNSIMTAKIYPSYNGSSSAVGTNMNHIRGFVYYTDVTATETSELSAKVVDLTTQSSWPEGWHGILVPDPDGTYYMLLTNLFADDTTPWENLTVTCPDGAPVFTQTTTINGNNAKATFYCVKNYNIANEFKVFVKGSTELKAVQADENSRAVYLKNEGTSSQTVTVHIIDLNGNKRSANVSIPANSTKFVYLNGTSVASETSNFPGDYRNVAYGKSVDAYSYDGAHLPFSVIDNDGSSYYKTLNTASSGNEYLRINLRNQYNIGRVEITPQTGETPPSAYVIQYGDNESCTNTISEVTKTSEEGKIILTFNPVNARFVKLKLLGSSQVSINKVAVYGEKNDDITIDPNDYTNYIANPDFELDGTAVNPPSGWTVSTSADTGTRSTTNATYEMNGSHGDWLFNTWQTGYPITQTTQVLPAGTYTLSCVVAADAGTRIFMIVDDDHSSYVDTSDKKNAVTLSHTFTLDVDKAVNIGVVSGNSSKEYVANGGLWYKVDDFHLTKVEEGGLTAEYFDNPSFEKDNISSLTADATRGAYSLGTNAPTGWIKTGDNPDVNDIMTATATATDNNFGAPGAPSDASQMYYMRVGWSNSNKSTIISATSTKPLPPGKYRISFDYRTGYANSASSSFVFSCADVSNSSVTFNKGGLSQWQKATIDFSLASAQTITPTIAITWRSGGSCLLMDNLQLEEIIDETDYVALNKQLMTDNAGDATFLIQDPKCESAANTKWTNSTAAVTLREHWSGEGYSNTYQERTTSGTISQTVSNMPAGTYKLVAALRANTGCTITPQLNASSGATFTGTGNNSTTVNQINKNGIQMPYNDYRGFTTKASGRGWQWGSATATLTEPGSLTINFVMNGSSWMSIDDVHLYYISDGTTTFCQSINADASTNEITLDDKTVTADIIVANPNTVFYSPAPIYTDNAIANNNLVNTAEMNNLVLYDGYPFACKASEFSITNASYVRNMPSYKWGTIILPYPQQSNENVQFYLLNGVNDEYMFFTEIDEAPANTPVAFRNMGSATNVSFLAENTTAIGTDQQQGSTTVTADGWTATGTYQDFSTTDENTYYIAQNSFYKTDASTGLIVNPFRSFLNGPSSSETKALGIKIGQFVPTDIKDIDSSNISMPQNVYSLDGRLIRHNTTSIQGLSKGIYIFDNKKVIVK